MNPNGIPENTSWEQLPIPNPVRADTLAYVWAAQETIATTGCWPEEYNTCTENFELQRQNCRDQSCQDRLTLALAVWNQSEIIPENIQEAIRLLEESNNGYSESWLPWQLLHRQQQWYVDIILWEWNNWYNNIYLQAFNTEVWNHILEITDFENQLKDTSPEKWNSLALVNYFKMLDSKEEFNIWNVIEKLWASQIIALWDLWKTSPNWPAMNYFQNNESLRWIVDGVTTISFESMIFSGNMENFQQISELFDVASVEDRQVIQETIHGLLYNALYDENVEQLRNIADIENIWGLNEWMYTFTVASARKMILAHESINSLETLYTWGPDVWDIAKALILSAVNSVGIWEDGEIQFSLDGINSIIEEYNTENNTQYPTLWDEYLQYLGSIFDTNVLVSEYATSMSRLTDINTRIRQIQVQLWDENIRPEEKELLRRELYWLYTQQYWTSQGIAQQRLDLEENYSQLLWYKDRIMDLAGSGVSINNLTLEAITYIRWNPQERVGKMQQVSDILTLIERYPEIMEGVNIWDIPSDFLIDSRVLRYFIERRGWLRQYEYGALPRSVFQSKELCNILAIQKTHWDTLLQNVFQNFSSRQEATQFIIELFWWENGDENSIFHPENDEERNELINAIPYGAYMYDEWVLPRNPSELAESSLSPGERMIQTINAIIDYEAPMPVDNINMAMIQPEVQELSLDFQTDSYSIYFHELNRMFREFWIPSWENGEIPEELTAGILMLGEQEKLWNIMGFFWILDTTQESHVRLSLQLLEQNPDVFRYFPKSLKLHPQILQELWSLGEESQQYLFMSLFETPEQIADYLTGYLHISGSEETIPDFPSSLFENNVFSSAMNRTDISNMNQFTPAQRIAFMSFLSHGNDIRQDFEKYNGREIPEISEIYKSNVQEYLASENISDESIEQIIWILDQEAPIESKLSAILRILELSWIESPEGRTEIIDRLFEIQSNRDIAVIETTLRNIDEGMTEADREILWDSLYINEDWGFSFERLREDYILYIAENNLQHSSESRRLFLDQTWIPAEFLTEEMRVRLQNFLRASVNISDISILHQTIYELWAEGFEIRLRNGTIWDYFNTVRQQRREQGTFFEPFRIEYSESWVSTIEDISKHPLTLNQGEISVSGERIFYTSYSSEGRIPISLEEVSIIQNNPEAERNLVQTFEAFQSTWLSRLWNLRENIFRGISNVQWLSFQVNEDYINIQELKIIFDSILQSIDEAPLTSTTLWGDNGIIAEMERRNGTNINWVEAQVNMRWESMIEERFILRYFPPWSLYFNQAVFEESLRI